MTAVKTQTTMIDPILARFGSQDPVLVSDGHVEEFMSNIRAMAGDAKMMEALSSEQASDDEFWFSSDDWRRRFRPYVVKEGTLMIPVKGVMINDFPWQFGKYATGYDYIWRCYERGMDDPEVRRIALLIHSPGGDVAGNFDLVDKMYERREEKPVAAFAAEGAYSAAYNIASVSQEIHVTRTGGVGSIGVLTMHIDQTKMLDQIGLKVTMVSAPEDGFKTERQPYTALSADAQKRMQTRVNELYDMFVGTVARNRGMDEEVIRDTKALTFGASEAVSLGLADNIASLEDALSAFSAEPETIENGDDEMATNDDKTKATFTQADVDAAVATAVATAKTDAKAEGMTEAKTRISAIVDSEEGKVRPTAANSAAMNTDMSAEQAIKFLGTLPAEIDPEADAAAAEAAAAETAAAADADKKSKAQGGDQFNQFMSEDNPELGGGSDDDADANGDDGVLQGSDLASAFGLGGFKKKPAAA